MENKYKSEGEEKIAEFLKEVNINFIYEHPFLIKDKNNKIRI